MEEKLGMIRAAAVVGAWKGKQEQTLFCNYRKKKKK